MRLLIQRVSHASVDIDGKTAGSIGQGLLILVGCRAGDTSEDALYLARRATALRIFRDSEDRMNLSVQDIGGGALLVSQFTLYADTRKGNRPGFALSGDPAAAEKLYEEFVGHVRGILGPERVGTGVFAADMKVSLCNDGPVTVLLDSDTKFPKETP